MFPGKKVEIFSTRLNFKILGNNLKNSTAKDEKFTWQKSCITCWKVLHEIHFVIFCNTQIQKRQKNKNKKNPPNLSCLWNHEFFDICIMFCGSCVPQFLWESTFARILKVTQILNEYYGLMRTCRSTFTRWQCDYKGRIIATKIEFMFVSEKSNWKVWRRCGRVHLGFRYFIYFLIVSFVHRTSFCVIR